MMQLWQKLAVGCSVNRLLPAAGWNFPLHRAAWRFANLWLSAVWGQALAPAF